MNILSWFFKRPLAVKLLLIGGVVALLGGGIFIVTSTTASKTTYQTAQIEKGDLVTSISASGTISSGNYTSITTNASGKIEKVLVKVGDTVKAGQIIATLTLDQEGKQKQASAWSSYLSAKNQLESAKAKLNSLQAAEFKANQTFMNGAVALGLASSDTVYIQQNGEWLQAEADYKNQANVITQAQASVTNAWYTYQQTSATLVAPLSGTVHALTVAPGIVLAAPSSTTTTSTQQVGTITQNQGKIQASVTLSEVDVAKVQPGQKAIITLDAFADKTFAGTVLAINTNGNVSSGVTTYPATLEFETTLSTIYPNMAVNAKIITDVINDVVLVPSAAVHMANGQSTVQIMNNGKPQVVVVQTEGANDIYTAVSTGVQEGDEVVVSTKTATTSTKKTTTTSPFSGLSGNRGFGGAPGR